MIHKRSRSLSRWGDPLVDWTMFTALVYSLRNHDESTVQRAYGTLHEVVEALPDLVEDTD